MLVYIYINNSNVSCHVLVSCNCHIFNCVLNTTLIIYVDDAAIDTDIKRARKERMCKMLS